MKNAAQQHCLRPVQDAWGKFDIVVVAVSIVGAGIDIGTPSSLTFLPIVRVLRVCRIFKLIPKAEGIKVLLRTLLLSLPGAHCALSAAQSLCGLWHVRHRCLQEATLLQLPLLAGASWQQQN